MSTDTESKIVIINVSYKNAAIIRFPEIRIYRAYPDIPFINHLHDEQYTLRQERCVIWSFYGMSWV